MKPSHFPPAESWHVEALGTRTLAWHTTWTWEKQMRYLKNESYQMETSWNRGLPNLQAILGSSKFTITNVSSFQTISVRSFLHFLDKQLAQRRAIQKEPDLSAQTCGSQLQLSSVYLQVSSNLWDPGTASRTGHPIPSTSLRLFITSLKLTHSLDCTSTQLRSAERTNRSHF